MKHHIILPIALVASMLVCQNSLAALCPFNNNKSCELKTDILKDKADSGLNYYAPTNYDHRKSGEINVYDVSMVQKATNGTLTLLAKMINTGYWRSGEIMTRADLTSPPYNAPTASEIWSTKNLTHGYLEVAVKLPVCTASKDNKCQQGTNPASYNQGLWPAIWLLPRVDNVWPQNGEIDIMEAYPKNTAFDITTGALHFNGNDPQCGGNDCRGWGFSLDRHQFAEPAYKKEHTWGFEWEQDPESTTGGYIMTGYIDNMKTWGPLKTDKLPADGANALRRGFNDPVSGYYLIVNLAIGGPYAGAPNGQTQAASMQVNTIKVYEVDNSLPVENCDVPTNITSLYTKDKKSITLNWELPEKSTNIQSFQIKNWQKKVLWEGTQLTWTESTLPGRAGTFTYYLNSVCTNKVSDEVKYDVIIPEITVCNAPADIMATYTNDKKNITLKWKSPASSLPVSGYQVRNWQKKLIWQGNSLDWTDRSLPGTNGTFIYFINTICNGDSSTMIQKDVQIK